MTPADAIALLALAAFVALAALSDLRKKTIPNKLNYAALAVAFALAFLEKSLNPYFVAFVAAAFCFAYALYAIGAWAGGDAKFFTASMAFYAVVAGPLREPAAFLAIPLAFLISAAFFAPLALALYWKKFSRLEFRKAFSDSLKATAFSVLALGILFAAYGALSKTLDAGALAVSLAWSAGFLLASTFFLKAVSLARKVLVNKAPVSKLARGMIPAQTLYLKGKGKKIVEWKTPSLAQIVGGAHLLPPKEKIVANAFRARGLSEKEISVLKRGGVKYLLVREALPYAPQAGAAVFLLALFAALASVA